MDIMIAEVREALFSSSSFISLLLQRNGSLGPKCKNAVGKSGKKIYTRELFFLAELQPVGSCQCL